MAAYGENFMATDSGGHDRRFSYPGAATVLQTHYWNRTRGGAVPSRVEIAACACHCGEPTGAAGNRGVVDAR